MADERIAVAGSERKPPENARAVGEPNPGDAIQVSIVLRRRARLPERHQAAPISREQFAAEYGADAADVARVEDFAQRYELTVTGVDLGRRTVILSGTIAAMNEAFGTTLKLYQGDQGTFRARAGVLYLTADLAAAVVGVFGLDNRPQAFSRCRRRRILAGSRAAGDTSYSPVDVARLYQFPSGATGKGQTVAIIELGGGYKAADLKSYFGQLGISPVPSVTAVSVDGAKNAPTGDPNSADGEVVLDIEIVGAIAPRARIAVYFAPNTDSGFLDAITTAVHDTVRKPSVVSISWGGAESTWTAQSLQAYDQAFQDATLLGVTVCCAAGDSGSSDGVADGLAHVDFPASSPHVVACGGTRLEATSGAISQEVVWNENPSTSATGGGVSDVFPLPAYQQTANVPVSVNPSHFKGRGVPDVSGDADPATGYQIHVDGQDAVFGGTSAVAPLWSAFVALLNEQRGTPLGYLNPVIYASKNAHNAFRDITSGNNGAYAAGPGWDPCTGLGSPRGNVTFSAGVSRSTAT